MWNGDNQLSEEVIRLYYQEDSDLYKCSKCDKLETRDNLHKQCAKCHCARYCSRECQVADWKNHKAICKHISEGPEKPHQDADTEDAGQRLEKFKEKYQPLLQIMTMFKLMKGNTRETFLADTHIVHVYVTDLTPACNYRAPQLEISQVQLSRIDQQEDFVQREIAQMQALSPSDMTADDATGFCMLIYMKPGSDEVTAARLKPFIWEECFTPMASDFLPLEMQTQLFNQEAEKYRNQINTMARGQADNLRKAAKRSK